ncbi:hypothetical protein AB6A40_011690 [Gnathostoma spinigerum]|uniref:Uncharacterized protein n=1 Tax=Gnathostoma spinigerum TaxID=75299 RepID=A0ABD6EYI6_9BILA
MRSPMNFVACGGISRMCIVTALEWMRKRNMSRKHCCQRLESGKVPSYCRYLRFLGVCEKTDYFSNMVCTDMDASDESPEESLITSDSRDWETELGGKSYYVLCGIE